MYVYRLLGNNGELKTKPDVEGEGGGVRNVHNCCNNHKCLPEMQSQNRPKDSWTFGPVSCLLLRRETNRLDFISVQQPSSTVAERTHPHIHIYINSKKEKQMNEFCFFSRAWQWRREVSTINGYGCGWFWFVLQLTPGELKVKYRDNLYFCFQLYLHINRVERLQAVGKNVPSHSKHCKIEQVNKYIVYYVIYIKAIDLSRTLKCTNDYYLKYRSFKSLTNSIRCC